MITKRFHLGSIILATLVAGPLVAQEGPDGGWGYSAAYGRPPEGMTGPLRERSSALDRLSQEAIRRPDFEGGAARAQARYAGDPTVSLSRLRNAPPPRAVKLVTRSTEAFRDGEKEKGVELLERAIEVHPNYIEARNNLGVYYHRTGRYDDAAKQFAAVLALDPSLAPTYTNMALALSAMGRLDEARAHARRGLELEPRSPAANYALGAILAIDHVRLGDAVEMFRLAAPEFPKAQLLAADLLLVQGKTDEARKELRGFLERTAEWSAGADE